MSKKSNLTEAQLRQVIRENIAEAYIQREKAILKEFVQAILSAVPKIAQYAPVVYGAVKSFTGGGSSVATPSNLGKAMDVLDMATGVTKAASGAGTALSGVTPSAPAAPAAGSFATRMTTNFNQYGDMAKAARDMAKDVFGNPQNTQQVQQAVGTMGQDLGRIGDQGIQAVFGKNKPQQMIDMSIAINKGGLADAALLYGAMKGLGTDEKVVRDVIARRSSNLKELSVEYAQFITAHPDEKDTDLISWLKGDGMHDEARLVAMATGVHKKGGLLGNFLAK
mgnify:CR=1 FL=1